MLNVVVPGFARHGLVGVTPTDHKGSVALADGVANQRVLGLQIEDIKLVDARWHQQKRLFIDFGSEWLVLKQLEKFVFKHHRTFGGGNVFSHLKQTLVCHGHMALLQVMQQVGDAAGNAFTLGVDGFFLGFGVEAQKITW